LARGGGGRGRPPGGPRGARGAGGPPVGHVPLDRFAGRIASLFPSGWPERPLWVCAVRLDDGARVVFGRERTVDVGAAVAASCAIPAYFTPVRIDGVRHVDGGVHSTTNLDVLGGLDLDLVIVSAPMSLARRALRRPAVDLPARSLLRWQLAREARAVRPGGTRVIAFQPTRTDLETMGSDSMDPRRRAATVRRARRSTEQRLERDERAREVAAALR
jgi:NTE family protein